MMRRAGMLLLVLGMLLALASPASAHKVLPAIPPPGPGGPPAIQLQALQVEATVESGVATVRMDQRFVNRSGAPAEGTYIFPLPQGAAVSSFQMFVDGEAYSAEVLDAAKAQSVYESIVRRNRDPALLQYIGQGLLQARVFPIPAGAERVIRVQYEQVLPKEGGLWELAIPLDDTAIPSVSITATLKGVGAGTVYSPTHTVGVSRRADGSASASFEGTQVRGDFKLYFGDQRPDLGVNLLSYKPGTEDGYFLLLVNPPAGNQAEVVAKDVLLVIDLSGSMQGEKFEQAKAAALQILGSLGKDDRFAVIGFHSDTVTYADELCGAADVADAMEFVRTLRLGGSTNIRDAMVRAQQLAGKNAGRPQAIVLITDGQPTVGVTDPDQIIADVKAGATGSQRIFTFGVGYDVNTLLLDGMAQENRGRSDYVKPGENLEAAVAAFWQKVGQPVLSDVKLSWDGVNAEEIYPRPVPDLYLGSQMVLLGRYRKGGTGSLTISGTVNGQSRSYTFKELAFTEKDSARDYIPRLWANRKVGYLLGEIRRNGSNKELIDEVVALSQRFGIATPYTSFFINEPGVATTAPGSQGPVPVGTLSPGQPGQAQDAGSAVAQKVAAAPTTGATAVNESKQVEQIRSASDLSQVQAAAAGAGEGQIRAAGDKTFVLKNGIWTDTAWKGGDLVYLTLGSDKYLELVRERPWAAKYLAVGSPLVVVDGADAFGIDIPGKEESAETLPAAMATAGPGTPRGGAVGVWVVSGVVLVGVLGLVAKRRRKTA